MLTECVNWILVFSKNKAFINYNNCTNTASLASRNTEMYRHTTQYKQPYQVFSLEWFQRKRHDFNSISNSDKTLAQTIKLNLVNILFKNILDKMMRKAKICKIPIQKRPNYIINPKLKFGIIFIKLWELAFNYKAK